MEPASHLLYHNSTTNRIGRKKRGDKSRKCARLVDYHRFGAGVLIQVGGKRLRTRRPQPPVEVPDIQFEVFMSIIQIRHAGCSEIKSKHLTKVCVWAKKYFSRSFFLSFLFLSSPTWSFTLRYSEDTAPLLLPFLPPFCLFGAPVGGAAC